VWSAGLLDGQQQYIAVGGDAKWREAVPVIN
jgi:hypothetical protein